ncbi:MAG: FtsQ-type POTRA domain-containing protein [Propionibacteriaceae bacterium]|nr:FtsQ-type POTRA domain-containing protein [Propionibacteriaceae bacterium]
MSPSATITRPRPREAVAGAKTQRRWSRRWLLRRVLIGIVILAVLAGGVWLVGFSSLLATKRVNVASGKTLDPDDVRSVAQVRLGVPLARQDVAEIAGRVATLRPVRWVEVTRSWPSTITITVLERTPVLAVPQSGSFLLVDEAGVSFRSVGTVPAGVVRADVEASDVALLTSAGMVANALPTGLKNQVNRIQVDSPDAIKLLLSNGAVVAWGSADDSVLKAQVTLALLKRKAATYDVSAPHTPATR